MLMPFILTRRGKYAIYKDLIGFIGFIGFIGLLVLLVTTFYRDPPRGQFQFTPAKAVVETAYRKARTGVLAKANALRSKPCTDQIKLICIFLA